MDNLAIMRELAEQIEGAGLARPEEIRGCGLREVEEVEVRARVGLPGMYQAFLLTMGRGAGHFLRGSVVYYPDNLGLTEDAQELLEGNAPPLKLPDDALAFFMHQGYQFAFVRTASGVDDPEVYHFLEGETAFRPLGYTFSGWLGVELEDQISIRRRW